MQKQFYKGIILVLASEDKPLYNFFRAVYQSYMNKNKNIKILFVYAGDVSFSPQEYDIVFPELQEGMQTPRMVLKTINAFEWIDQNYDYEFLIRTNLSTFWVLDRLEKFLDILPKTKCLLGRKAIFEKYVAGFAIVMSRDIIRLIIENRQSTIYESTKFVPEDFMLVNYIVKNKGIQIKNFPIALEMADQVKSVGTNEQYDACDETLIYNLIEQGLIAYRVRSHHNREVIDTFIMRKLLNKFYGIDLGGYYGNV